MDFPFTTPELRRAESDRLQAALRASLDAYRAAMSAAAAAYGTPQHSAARRRFQAAWEALKDAREEEAEFERRRGNYLLARAQEERRAGVTLASILRDLKDESSYVAIATATQEIW